jgi:hypothetical protein
MTCLLAARLHKAVEGEKVCSVAALNLKTLLCQGFVFLTVLEGCKAAHSLSLYEGAALPSCAALFAGKRQIDGREAEAK